MITYINRKELDVLKYDNCIENSKQSRIYAFSWYLDIVADNWDVLVLDDYEAVMPIPWKQKYFIKYVTQPFFCQQLGIFSKQSITKELQNTFINNIPKKYVKVSLNFNSDNFLGSKMNVKNNHVLPLSFEYEQLFKSFKKGRKHAVKVGEKNNLYVKFIDIEELIKLKKEFYNYENFSKEKLDKISSYALKNNSGFVLGVFKDEVLLGGGLFLTSKKRIAYLFSAFNLEGRKIQAASFLIKSVIEKNQNSGLVLDFEGGNLPNMSTFFKSFGSHVENYHQLSYNLFFKK